MAFRSISLVKINKVYPIPSIFRNIWFLFKWGLLITAVLGAGLAVLIAQRVDTEVSRYILAELRKKYPELEVEVDSVKLIDSKGITIRGLSLSDPKRPGGVPVLQVEEVFVDCPITIQTLLKQKTRVSRVTMRRPKLHLTRNHDGQFRELALLTPSDSSDRHAVMRIVDGSLRYNDERRGDGRVITIDSIHLDLTPPGRHSLHAVSIQPAEPENDTKEENRSENREESSAFQQEEAEATSASRETVGRWTFQGHAKGAILREILFDGWCDPETSLWGIAGRVRQFEWFPELISFVPEWKQNIANSELRRVLESFTGRVDFGFNILRDPAAPLGVRFTAEGGLSHAYITVPRLRKTFSEMTAKFRFGDHFAEIENMTAVNGTARLVINYRQIGLLNIEQGSITTSIRELDIDGLIIEQILPFLPPSTAELASKFTIEGKADIDAVGSWDGRKWVPRHIELQGRKAMFTYGEFPYMTNNLFGRIDFRNNEKGESVFSFDFETAAGETPHVGIVGRYADLLNDPNGGIEIRGTGVPINEKLMRMLPDKYRRIVASLRPKGSVNAIIRLSNPPGDGPMHKEIAVGLDNCEITYEKFPYPLREICGQLNMIDDSWSFENIFGRNESAEIHCKGYLVPRFSGNTSSPASSASGMTNERSEQGPAYATAMPNAPVATATADAVPLGFASSGRTSLGPVSEAGPPGNPAKDAEFSTLMTGAPPRGFVSATPPLSPLHPPTIDRPLSAEPDYQFALWIIAKDLPLNEGIQEALPDPNHRELLKSLRAKGKVDLNATVLFIPSVNRLSVTFDAVPCPGLSFQPIHFPYLIENVTGLITYLDNGTLEVKGLRGTNKDTVLMSDFFCDYRSDGSWRLRIDPLRIDRLPPDQHLRDALPSNLQAIFEQLQLSGALNLRGKIEFSKLAAADAPMQTVWDLGIILHQNAAVVGMPVRNIFGKLDLSGLSANEELQVRGTLDLSTANVNDFQLGDIKGPFYYDSRTNTILLGQTGPVPEYHVFPQTSAQTPVSNSMPRLSTVVPLPPAAASPFIPPPARNIRTSQPSRLLDAQPTYRGQIPENMPQVAFPTIGLPERDRTVRERSLPDYAQPSPMVRIVPQRTGGIRVPITGSIYGGSFAIEGKVEIVPTLSYEVAAQLIGADLALIAAELQPDLRSIQGKVHCQTKLRGRGYRTETLDGFGEVQLRDAYLYELPLMMKVLQVVSIGEPDRSAFSAADIGFRIQGNRVILNPIFFEGSVLSLNSISGTHGELRLDTREVNMQLGARFGNRRSQIPVISDVLGKAGEQLMAIQISGPLSGPPIVTRVPFPSIRETIRTAQEENALPEESGGSRHPSNLPPPPPDPVPSKNAIDRLRFWNK